MQYCVDNPEEISKLAKVKAQVSEVKGVMMENIEKVKFLVVMESVGFFYVGSRHDGTFIFVKSLIFFVIGRFSTVERRLSFWWIKQRIFALRSVYSFTVSLPASCLKTDLHTIKFRRCLWFN